MASNEDIPYRQYTRSLLLKTGYRATWLPSKVLELGAVGHLRDGLFDQRARLRDWGISAKPRPNPTKDSIEYQSSQGVSTRYKVAGESSTQFQSLGTAHAGVRLQFSRAGAVVFAAPDCVYAEIDNKRRVEQSLREAEDWDMDWVVIMTVVKAKTATILLSGSSEAYVELRAEADLSPGGVEVADLGLGFSRARTSGMAVKLVSHGSLTPLYEAFRMTQPFGTRDPRKRKLVPV